MSLDRQDNITPSADSLGQELYGLIERLYPICRSITGNGLRQTLRMIDEVAGLDLHEVASGTPVYDWTVPKEWNIADAYVADAKGKRVINFRESNLHVVGYSTPVRARMSLAELRPHLHSLPDKPDWIPYRNAYYQETWGFCLSDKVLRGLPDGEYEVRIDSSLQDGHLTYGEAYLPGASTDEVLISTHACHPSLCNDNLSGLAIAAHLVRHLRQRKRRLSYRFLFLPCTIGPLVWLSRNEDKLARIKHGLVLACLGDPGGFTYLRSRRGDAEIDRALAQVLRQADTPHRIKDFEPYGYDQRQYCSPGFDLPVGCLMRTQNGGYPEYHTSADDLSLVRPAALANSFSTLMAAIDVLEGNGRYLNQSPKGEPHLGRRGLYGQAAELGLMWLLNFSDGRHSLLDIAERSGMPFATLRCGAAALERVGLLKRIEH